jgi:hypothetical protein
MGNVIKIPSDSLSVVCSSNGAGVNVNPQAALAATTITNVYTVPVGKNFEGNFTICNQSGANRSFRMSIAIGGAVDTPSQYWYFNTPLPKDTSYEGDREIKLKAGDVIRFYASGTGLSVNINGIETDV